MWQHDVQAGYVRPAPGKAKPGTLKLVFGEYVIVSNFGRCYAVVDDTGRAVAGGHNSGHVSDRELRRKGLKALKQAQKARTSGALEPVEVVVDKDEYIRGLERQLGVEA